MHMVPSVSFSTWNQGEAGQRAFANEFGLACEQIGFAMITDHGIKPELFAAAYRCMEQLYSHSDEELLPYAIPADRIQIDPGFVPFGVEIQLGETIADQKRYWDVYRELAPGQAPAPDYVPNRWPDTHAPDFKHLMTEVFNQLEGFGLQLIAALEMYLDMKPGHMQNILHQSRRSMMRVYHYPPIRPDHQGTRGAPHFDLNLLTLIPRATKPGLELQATGQSDWVPLKSAPGSISVNIGNMLKFMSRGRLQSTRHRVSNPAEPNLAAEPRFVFPFFLQPRGDAIIDEATGMTSDDHFNEIIGALSTGTQV